MSAPRATAEGVDRFYANARREHLAPLWTFYKEWFTAEPRIEAVPHLWRYEALRPLVMESAHVISAADAERRVLALENPGVPGGRLATGNLFAGLQMLAPGETAPTHRHSPAALRFIIEGHGAYTAVDGEKACMAPGDFIATPSWAWHEHGNEGDGPVVWMDVLDVALVRLLGAGFAEHRPGMRFRREPPPGDNLYRYGMNMRPVGDREVPTASRVFSHTYARARDALERVRAREEWDPCHGLKMQYIDPSTGGPAIPTISTFLQLLPRGFATRPYKSTSGAIFSAVEGCGQITVGAPGEVRRFDYAARDIWTIPSWQPATVRADEDSVIFVASDEAVQRKLGLWREWRGE